MYYEVLIGFGLLSSLVAKETPPQLSRPMIRNIMGRYLNHPGLAFQPHINLPSTLIRFNKARPSTYVPYSDLLETFLTQYSNEMQTTESGDRDDCAFVRGYRPQDQWDRPCRFDLRELGPDCVTQQSFGYEDGQPCVLFNLERIFRWLPVPYDNSSVPETIRDLWSQYSVTLKCEGTDPPSRDNMGDVTYFPPHGFAFKYFPYLGQYNWKNPLVFVRFENPMPAVLIRVQCMVYAENIIHNRILNTGMVNFELMVD